MNELEELAEILADQLARGEVDRKTVARRTAAAAASLPADPPTERKPARLDASEDAFCAECGLPKIQPVRTQCAPNHVDLRNKPEPGL